MKNPNLTITLPDGFLSGKPLAKLQSFNEKVAEHDKGCATLELDATGDAIDEMTVEVLELEQWQHIIRRTLTTSGRGPISWPASVFLRFASRTVAT